MAGSYCECLVRSPVISPGKFANINIWLTRTYPQSKLFWNNSSGARPCDDDACRRADALDDPAGSFPRVYTLIALLSHHPRGQPLKAGLVWLTRKWLGRIIKDRGPGEHNPEEDALACIDLLKAKINNGVFTTELFVAVTTLTFFAGFSWVRRILSGFEPVLARTARSHSRNRGPNGART